MLEAILNALGEGKDIQLNFKNNMVIIAMKENDEETFNSPVVVKKLDESVIASTIVQYAKILSTVEEPDVTGLENVKSVKKEPKAAGKTKAKANAEEKPAEKESAEEKPADPKSIQGPNPELLKLPSEERIEKYKSESSTASQASPGDEFPEPVNEPVKEETASATDVASYLDEEEDF